MGLIREDLDKQPNGEPQPEATISIPTDNIKTICTAGWRVAQLSKHGWKQGQGLGNKNDGSIVPVEMTNRPTGNGVMMEVLYGYLGKTMATYATQGDSDMVIIHYEIMLRRSLSRETCASK